MQSRDRLRQMQVIACLGAVILAVGCRTGPLGPYVSPRVQGQVLAANNHQPLSRVRVSRGSARSRGRGDSRLKGGELLMQKRPALTDGNGTFNLPGERVLSVFRGSGWSTVSLTFDRAGFHHFQTNFPLTLLTNTPEGEPVLNVGVVTLQPL